MYVSYKVLHLQKEFQQADPKAYKVYGNLRGVTSENCIL